MEAEIEVELDLVPNLVIDESGASSQDLTVDVAPQIWFGAANGDVLDLSRFDWDATHQLLELEVEMEHGFIEVELDD